MQKKEKAQNVIDSFLFHINKSASMLTKQSNVIQRFQAIYKV